MCVVDQRPSPPNASPNRCSSQQLPNRLRKKNISSDDDRSLDALVDAHGRKGRGIGAYVDEARAGE
jgi:hypothetical protein